MKKSLLFIYLFLFSLFASAQDKITFTYDVAGNQTQRCINCVMPTAKYVSNPKLLTKEDLIKDEVSDQVSYYPNPVKQELYLSWELANNNTISSIHVYSMNGQLVQSYQHTDKINLQTIPFQEYATGMYAVVLRYSNGEQKSIKIIKQ